jgi:RNA polymerase sigma factor (sigma-70 family)
MATVRSTADKSGPRLWKAGLTRRWSVRKPKEPVSRSVASVPEIPVGVEKELEHQRGVLVTAITVLHCLHVVLEQKVDTVDKKLNPHTKTGVKWVYLPDMTAILLGRICAMNRSGCLTQYTGYEAYRPFPGYSDGDLRVGSYFVAETDSTRPAHFSSLVAFLKHKGKSQEDAEDLAQEALLRLHVYAKDHAVLNEGAFLRQVVHYLSIDHYRSHRYGALLEIPLDDVEAQAPLIDPRSTPDQILDSQQQLEELSARVEAVGPRTLQIYIANRYGYSRAEIAIGLGVAEITVHRHMSLALAALSKKHD